MPNWCHNHMEITGPSEEIERFKQTCIRDGQIDFNAFVPMPDDPPMPASLLRVKERCLADWQGAADWQTIQEWIDTSKVREAGWLETTGYRNPDHWAGKHWGTTNACRFYGWDKGPNRYECSFDTAWTPPVPVWDKIGEMFPALDVELSGSEEMGHFAFRGTIRQGKLDIWEVPVVMTVTDPRTCETVTGTMEEIHALLDELEAEGKRVGTVTMGIGEAA